MTEFKSNLESDFSKYLTRIGIDHCYEPIKFYVGPNDIFYKKTTYTPDFYLPAYDFYVELKSTTTQNHLHMQKQLLKIIELSMGGIRFMLVRCSRGLKRQNATIIQDGAIVNSKSINFIEAIETISNGTS